MAFNGTDEDILKLLESHGRLYPFINVELDPCQHPEHLPNSAYTTDGRAYFYLNFDKVSGQASRIGWIQHSNEEAIRDVSEIIGFKETFKFARNGRIATNWSMTKYYLYKKSSPENKNAIYVICNN